MTRLRILGAALALVALANGATPALGQGKGHDRAREAVRAGDIRPLGEVLENVRRAYPGAVLDVKLLDRGPPADWRYEVRVQTPEGHVIAVLVDAETAKVAGARGGGAGGGRR